MTLIRSIAGFFYAVFIALGRLGQHSLRDVLANGILISQDNPFTDYVFPLFLNPADAGALGLFDIVDTFIALDMSTITIFEFTLVSVVSLFVVALLVRVVAMFIPTT